MVKRRNLWEPSPLTREVMQPFPQISLSIFRKKLEEEKK